jgi:uridine kinase
MPALFVMINDMTIQEIANAIKSKQVSHRPILIAIEGFGGAGKTTFSKKLKEMMGNAYIVQADDFIIKEKLTLVSPDMESYDKPRLEEQVLIPASKGEAIIYQKLDWTTNKLSEPIEVPKVDYLIVEGISSYHPDIAKYYDYKIWIDTPIKVANQRGKLNDAGTENEQYWDLWSKNDLAYKEKYQPEKVADFIYENS